MRFTTGNLLDSPAEALVNTVNTVGVMGKGIALMFKERFPENFKAYAAACNAGTVEIGRMFVTERAGLLGPRYIINFPTKRHWRQPSRLEWVDAGLDALAVEIAAHGIRSIALPPLGAGNGGLDWREVRPLIEHKLASVTADVTVYEPSAVYRNVEKRRGVERLTPARAMMAEMVRRYAALGLDCTVLEAQKLAWFLQNAMLDLGLADALRLRFLPARYGPYDDALRHLLDSMDGSFLTCGKRLADAGPLEPLWFNDARREEVRVFLGAPEVRKYRPAVKRATAVIEGFESPYGMELLATVDWLVRRHGVPLSAGPLRSAIAAWPGGAEAAARKMRLLRTEDIELAAERLRQDDVCPLPSPAEPMPPVVRA